MRPERCVYRHFILIFCLLVFTFSAARGQQTTTAFNFQGRLNDGGAAANGNYDFQFKLFDQLAGGAQVGPTVERANLQVINGVFSTTLDFGAGAFSAGNRFLEIAVRPAGSSNAHVVLGARQQILAVPFAVQATNSQTAVNSQTAINAQTAQNSVNSQNAQRATTATNSLSLGGNPASSYARLNIDNDGSVSATQLRSTGNVSVDGNAVQRASSNGFVKAMLNVGGLGSIFQCYNGVTGSSTGNCGFTLTTPLGNVGVYRINFGFPVNTRFAVATSKGFTSTGLNAVPIIAFLNETTLEVYLTRMDSPADTTTSEFTIIVY